MHRPCADYRRLSNECHKRYDHIMTSIKEVHRLLGRARQDAGLSQEQLAHRAGTSQPAIARLEQGGSNPTIETLARFAAAAGYTLRVELVPDATPDPVVERYKEDVDRTLLRDNLRKTVTERVRTLGEWQEVGRELERATRQARRRR